MKSLLNKKLHTPVSKKTDLLISELVLLHSKIEKLPPLSAVEKAKLEQSFAIDQLYYSSKLEGTILTEKMIENAIHGKELPTA